MSRGLPGTTAPILFAMVDEAQLRAFAVASARGGGELAGEFGPELRKVGLVIVAVLGTVADDTQ